MGLIRGGLAILFGVLLFVSLLAVNSFATFSLSLNYDNVRSNVYPLVSGLAESSLPADISSNLNLTNVAIGENQRIINLCKSQNITYNFSYENFTVEIPCDTAAQGTGAIINKTIDDVLRGIYYTHYNCNFWNCFSKNQFPFFLISQKAHDYWKGKMYLMLLVSLVLAALVFLFMENRINAPLILGILIAVSAIPILKLSSLISAVVGQPVSYIIGIFFSKAATVFWISFIIGLVLIGLGIALKIMNVGFIKDLLTKKPEEKKTTKQQPEQIQKKTKPKKK